MSEKTLKMLVKALSEELDEMAHRPECRLITDDPTSTIGEWCRRDQAFHAFGLSPHRLKQLVIEGKVIAKKMDPTLPTSVIIFKTADIRRAVESLPDYKYEQTEQNNEREN